jgi:hypothetical protein
MSDYKTTYQLWEEGELTADDALDKLVASLDAVKDRLEPAQAEEKILRDQISMVLEHVTGGKKAQVRGYELIITEPGVTVSYDSKALDKLVIRLMEDYPAIAADIRACRKESSRAGSLRVTKSRGN